MTVASASLPSPGFRRCDAWMLTRNGSGDEQAGAGGPASFAGGGGEDAHPTGTVAATKTEATAAVTMNPPNLRYLTPMSRAWGACQQTAGMRKRKAARAASRATPDRNRTTTCP